MPEIESSAGGKLNFKSAVTGLAGLPSSGPGAVNPNKSQIEKYYEAHAHNDADESHQSIHHTLGLGNLQAIPASLLDNIAPIGEILDFVGGSAKIPPGFMLCDGRSLPKANYVQLFAVIGYAYGGAGANFNLPDSILRGTIGAETDAELGLNDGLAVGSRSHTTPAHDHTVSIANHDHSVLISGGVGLGGGHQHTGITATAYNNGVHSHTTDGPSGTTTKGAGTSDAAGPTHTHNVNGSGDHSHLIDVSNTSFISDHAHTFNASTATSSAGGASTSSSSSGGGTRVPFLNTTKMIRYSWGFKETSY